MYAGCKAASCKWVTPTKTCYVDTQATGTGSQFKVISVDATAGTYTVKPYVTFAL